MNLEIDTKVENAYKSASQTARYFTERWFHSSVLCPRCGGNLNRYPNNRPVADFHCESCTEDFELKATSSKIGKSIPDGAFATMMARLLSRTNPSLFLLRYNSENWSVSDLVVIPKHYFTPDIIQKRLPLSKTARRAGWTGCNILVGKVPHSGRIPLVIDRVAQPLNTVISAWSKTKFLREVSDYKSRTWLLETMFCIDLLRMNPFELKNLYQFELRLKESFPNNRHIREKLRQQLQILRDKGYLTFLSRGRYMVNMPTRP